MTNNSVGFIKYTFHETYLECYNLKLFKFRIRIMFSFIKIGDEDKFIL